MSESPNKEPTPAAVAAQVDSAAAAAEHDFAIAAALHQSLNVVRGDTTDSAAPGPASWTFWAFEYHAGRGDPANLDHFQPPLLFADGTGNIPALEDLPVEALQWLAALAAETRHPRAIARLGHLLFLRRHGNAGNFARMAVEGYLGFPQGSTDIDAADALRTALDLSKRIGDANLAEEAVRRIVDTIRAVLATEDPPAGIVLGLLDTLAAQKQPPVEVDDLIQDAKTAYLSDIHNLDITISLELRRALADTAQVATLWGERVTSWIAAAERADPLVGTVHLRRAVEHARTSGDPQLLERATAKEP